MGIKLVTAADLVQVLDYAPLIDHLDEAFRQGCTLPVRHVHAVACAGEPDASLLLMPAWREGAHIGVKVVAVVPGNAARNLSAIQASYLLMDGRTGEMLALMDGHELTVRRTGAASALASRYLSRPQSRRLVMVGTGGLAPHLVRAHAAVRPIRDVQVWGRTPAKARALAERLAAEGFAATATEDLERAVRQADIISCATLATEPLVLGRWLASGQHLDLVGSFRPAMHEADDEAMRRANVYVDTRDGALAEAGELIGAIERGVIAADAVVGDLFDLARGTVKGRRSADEITLFKSVGTALEDLAAATLAVRGL